MFMDCIRAFSFIMESVRERERERETETERDKCVFCELLYELWNQIWIL